MSSHDDRAGCWFHEEFPKASRIGDGTDQNTGFIFTFDDESKGLAMKADSEFGLALGVGVLCRAATGKLC